MPPPVCAVHGAEDPPPPTPAAAQICNPHEGGGWGGPGWLFLLLRDISGNLNQVKRARVKMSRDNETESGCFNHGGLFDSKPDIL